MEDGSEASTCRVPVTKRARKTGNQSHWDLSALGTTQFGSPSGSVGSPCSNGISTYGATGSSMDLQDATTKYILQIP